MGQNIGPINLELPKFLEECRGKDDVIIICEGPDGAGKTTLARQLEQRGYHYVHNGVPKPDENLFELYTNQVLAAGYDSRNVVFDRLHLGELVYGTIVRKKSLLTIEQIRLLNRLLASKGALTILCMPWFDTILDNWRSRQGKEYVQDPSMLEQIYNLYRTLLYEYRGAEHVVWDYTTGSQIVPPECAITCPGGVIGSPRARFLFIGEKAGGPHDLAFYSHKRSSHYLNECLWEAGYQEHELAFTNAYAMDGKPRKLNRLVGSDPFNPFQNPTVIALGNLAQRRCDMDDVEHFKAPHPQYVKRFKSRQRWRYVELLRTFREA